MKHSKNKILHWKYAPEVPGSLRNDEEVIQVDLEAFSEGFVFIYLFSKDFEPHLGRFESLKSAEYRLCDSDSDVNFVHNPLGNGYQDMFAVNPDDLRSKPQEPDDNGVMPPPPPKLVGAVGCFMLYHSKGNLIVDHLNSSCYDRIDEQEFVSRVIKFLPETNCSGDTKGLQAFWSASLERKKAAQSNSKNKQHTTLVR